MWQRFRSLFLSIGRFFKQLFSSLAGEEPTAPPAPASTESYPQRSGPGEPELGFASQEPPVYRRRKSLFSNAELEIYEILKEEVGEEYQIFAKVRLGDFIYLANEPPDRKFHNNQIQCKHVDFLLCARHTQRPLMVIELDDSSHTRYDRRQRDEFKKRVFDEVGLKLLSIPVQPFYPPGEIGSLVRSTMQEEQHPA